MLEEDICLEDQDVEISTDRNHVTAEFIWTQTIWKYYFDINYFSRWGAVKGRDGGDGSKGPGRTQNVQKKDNYWGEFQRYACFISAI